MTADVVAQLETALAVLLDQVDYTEGACNPTEMVAAVVQREVIERARQALAESRAWRVRQA